MGAGWSGVTGAGEDDGWLGDLPESCVASILLHLEPPEICGVARLNRAFRGAASSDLVWESKLPENYEYLVEKAGFQDEVATIEGRRRLSKKEIYARLCRPNPFDGQTKIFWLEKWKGGMCLSISSKALIITGIDDRRYWNYISTDESRFQTVAYLQQIWWLEVDGQIDFWFPPGSYSLFFRLQLGRASKKRGRRLVSSEHVHGWDAKPVRFQLSTSSGQQSQMQCYLDELGNWIHYHVGDFAVDSNAKQQPTNVKFSMTQIDCTHTKGGLCVDSVLICPSGFRPEKVFKG